MERNARPRLHPLLAVAAISVITVSAAGVGALTGVLPRTSASSAPAPENASPAHSMPAPASAPTVSAPLPAAAPVAPAPQRRKPQVVRTRAPGEERHSDNPVVVRENAASPDFEQRSVAQRVPAAANLGTVESVHEIAQAGEGTGLGAIAGGVLGGVIGHQFGGGSGKKILTVAGAAGGAYAGHQVEKQARGTKRWEINVRMDNGALHTVSSDTAPSWRAGDRVRVVDGQLGAA